MGSDQPKPLRFYHLEDYLFGEVHDRFHADKEIRASDFFAIVMWKSNRAKSKIAHRLLNGRKSLDDAVQMLTRALSKEPDAALRCLMSKEWGFRLPMASAILTVFWPDKFTVYDVRACDTLAKLGAGDFSGLSTLSYSLRLVSRYEDYRRAVEEHTPADLPLRDKDRFLWGQSALDQLERDIKSGFCRQDVAK